jgi:hypothetical protein
MGSKVVEGILGMLGMRLKGLKDGMMRCGLGIGLVADDGSGGGGG